MKQVRHPFLFFSLPLATVFSLTYFTIAKAQQVTSDGTVSTTVTTPDGKNFNINDGTRRGGNLFHSFKEFSVPTGGSANFNNAVDVRNIIGRVTGGSVSTIDGLIRTLGKANLFLLNPAGIIFGTNARLNIGGSFLGSTANSFVFDNGFEFSATNPQAPPLLTITAPVGLSYRENFKNITNQSRAIDNNGNLVGLTVPEGNSLTLVGGNVNLDGGILFAPGGRVELGGLSATGTIGLNNDGSLSFPVGVQRSDVSLTNAALVDVSSGGGGSIAVNARNLNISGGSIIRAGIGEGLGTVGSQAGDISVNATGAINLNNSQIFNDVRPGANGQGGDVNISANSLRLESGGQVSASTLGPGKGGNLRVDAQDVQLIGKSGLFASAQPNSTGDAGDLTINTNTLLLRDGARVSVESLGTGTAGNININSDRLIVFDTSNITANSASNSGGTIRINTQIIVGFGFYSVFWSDHIDRIKIVVDPAQQIAQNPCIKGFGNSFTITGRGGLPTDPNKILSSDNVRVDLIQPIPSKVSLTTPTQKQPSKKPPVKQIIPAQGWIYNDKGQVVLVGYDPTKTGSQRSSPAPTGTCAATK